MQYILEFNGRSYDLPKYTNAVKKDIVEINKRNEDVRVNDIDKYKGMYNFIKKMVGEDNAKEIFETDNIDEMDLNEITICFLGICNGYDKPVNEYQRGANTISDEDKQLVMEVIKNAGNVKNLENFINKNQRNGVRPPFAAL